MLALHRHPIGRLQDCHLGMAGQQLDHQARMSRIEMLNQDERHPDIGGQRVEEATECVEAARGRAKRDDQKVIACDRDLRGRDAVGPRPSVRHRGRAALPFPGPSLIAMWVLSGRDDAFRHTLTALRRYHEIQRRARRAHFFPLCGRLPCSAWAVPAKTPGSN